MASAAIATLAPRHYCMKTFYK